MRFKWFSIPAGLAVLGLACSAATQAAIVPTAEPARSAADITPAAASDLASDYDPARDPAQDVQAAIGVAGSQNKRILLEVGGEWCSWCHTMDAFIDAHPDLLALRDENYVMVKVNFSEENENEAFLSQYPEISGYPHIFVLDSDGSFLHSQNTAELEEGESYNLERFTAFLQEWAAP